MTSQLLRNPKYNKKLVKKRPNVLDPDCRDNFTAPCDKSTGENYNLSNMGKGPNGPKGK